MLKFQHKRISDILRLAKYYPYVDCNKTKLSYFVKQIANYQDRPLLGLFFLTPMHYLYVFKCKTDSQRVKTIARVITLTEHSTNPIIPYDFGRVDIFSFQTQLNASILKINSESAQDMTRFILKVLYNIKDS